MLIIQILALSLTFCVKRERICLLIFHQREFELNLNRKKTELHSVAMTEGNTFSYVWILSFILPGIHACR